MDIGWPEIAIIAVVVLVLFGSKKLPDAARSLGRSMRILKAETKGLRDDDDKPGDTPPQVSAAQQQAQLPAPHTVPGEPARAAETPAEPVDRR